MKPSFVISNKFTDENLPLQIVIQRSRAVNSYFLVKENPKIHFQNIHVDKIMTEFTLEFLT